MNQVYLSTFVKVDPNIFNFKKERIKFLVRRFQPLGKVYKVEEFGYTFWKVYKVENKIFS